MIRRIGQYDVHAVIGEGGMGTVYRALDPRFGRTVAVKVLHSQYQRDPEFVDRFKKEAVLQAQLSHPNIVSVIDFIADASALAMVLEYVDGPSLADVVRDAAGPIAEGRSLRLMIQVLGALHFAHERQIVHRDVKPANILVVTFDGHEVAKVLDFGIAKITGDDKGRTQAGAKMGTLGYMSPEQIQSPKDTDRRSDVYSAGVVLYELLTGRVPFDADTEYEMMRRIVKDPPRFDGVSGRVGKILARALDKDPGRRFQTAGLMRDALAGLVTGVSDLPSPSLVPASPSRTLPATVGAVVVVVMAAGAGTWVYRSGVADRWFGPAAAEAPPVADLPQPWLPTLPAAAEPTVPAVVEPPPPTRPAAKMGRAVVGQLPWPLESVTIGGRVIRKEATLEAGPYTVVYAAEVSSGLQPIRVTVPIVAGQSVDLATRVPTGSFEFRVEINDFRLKLGSRLFTPATQPRVAGLPVGTYRLSISSYTPGYAPYDGEVVIRAHELTFHRFTYGSDGWITKSTR